MNPYEHRCNVPDVDYSQAQSGRITCTVCGATWTRTKRGWHRTPEINNYRRNHND